jgi:hypothetical protein
MKVEKVDKALAIVATGAFGTGVVGGLTDQAGLFVGGAAVGLTVGVLGFANALRVGHKPARSNSPALPRSRVIEGEVIETPTSTDLALSQVRRGV